MITSKEHLHKIIEEKFAAIKIVDMHTHLFDPCFEEYNLFGIDHLLTYHYLISETFRQNPNIEYDYFNALSTKEKAEVVWRTLFVENTPVSEVTRSIITIFRELGLDTGNKDLAYYRKYFDGVKMSEYVDKVFALAGLSHVVMTNDPFDEIESNKWDKIKADTRDDRFKAALRLDQLLMTPDQAFEKLYQLGVIKDVKLSLDDEKTEGIKGFLKGWINKIEAQYCAVSLPPDFVMDDDGSLRSELIKKCVIPVCIEMNRPFAMMIGVRRGVNPHLALAGDALGKLTLDGLEYICKHYPSLKILATVLTLEDQHGLAVLARKFKNLMVFGCWWFVNNPSLIESITQMRMELLGTTFIPQHSDCRVLEQLISKWNHSKVILEKVLVKKYADLMDTGYPLTQSEVERDMDKFFRNNYLDLI